MENSTKNELLSILNEGKGNLYDFICNHYWEMSKDELKDLAKECIALMYHLTELRNSNSGKELNDYSRLYADLKDNLADYTSLLED